MTDTQITCDGCGACCMEQNGPPGYIAAKRGVWPVQEDIDRVNSLSGEAARLLEEYEQSVINGSIIDGLPCVWYDAETQQCRFYEERPSICRDFELGGAACLSWRKQLAV